MQTRLPPGGRQAALPARKGSFSRATVFLTVASLVSLAVLLLGIALPALRPTPQVAWHVGDDQAASVQQFAEVSTGTPIGLVVDLPYPAHVYVASWSELQGTIALFPSDRLASALRNPLPAGRHALPGVLDSKAMTWPTHSVVGPIHYFAVASRERLAELEDVLHRTKQMGHMARLGPGFTDRNMYVFAPEGGLQVLPPNDRPAAVELDAARTAFHDLAALGSAGPMRELSDRPGVFVRPLVLQGR